MKYIHKFLFKINKAKWKQNNKKENVSSILDDGFFWINLYYVTYKKELNQQARIKGQQTGIVINKNKNRT